VEVGGSSIPIRRAFGQDPANTASRIGHITVEAGDDVNVRVFHGLAGGSAVVDPDIEAIGIQPGLKLISHPDDEMPDVRLGFGIKVE